MKTSATPKKQNNNNNKNKMFASRMGDGPSCETI